MFPTIAKIVFVKKTVADLSDLIKSYALLAANAVVNLKVRNSEGFIAYAKDMQMGVRPAHRGLNDAVQSPKMDGSRNSEATPDRRVYIAKRNLQLVDIHRDSTLRRTLRNGARIQA